MKLRAPAIPLITVDPFFTVWSADNVLNHSKTEHWSGKGNSIIGSAFIDGKEFVFLGYHRDKKKLPQISVDIDALSTTAVFENENIRLTAKFITPLLPDDFRLLTRPVSYMEVRYESIDGKEHEVKINVAVSEELCLDEQRGIDVTTEEIKHGKLTVMKMGNENQNVLNKSGDDVRIDWGYCYLATDCAEAQSSFSRIWGDAHINVSAPLYENKAENLFALTGTRMVKRYLMLLPKPQRNTKALNQNARSSPISSITMPLPQAVRNTPNCCPLPTVRLLQDTSSCLTKTAKFCSFQRNAIPTAVPLRLTFPTRLHLCFCFTTPSL